MSETTRTFVAVEVPHAARRVIEQIQNQSAGSYPGLRWTSPEQMHLTLAFLGDVPSAELNALGLAVDQAVASIPAFDLRIEGLGAFPSPRRPRVLWAGIKGDPTVLDQLFALRAAVVQAVSAIGYPPTDDRFHPHITLARLKAGRGRGPAVDLSELCRVHESWHAGALPVASVITFASTLTPRGPVYTPLRTSPLAKNGPEPPA